MRKLVANYHVAAVEHFSELARSVAENPSLETRERIEALYQGLREVSKLILRLSASVVEDAATEKPTRVRRGAKSLQSVSQQLIDHLSIVEGARWKT